MRLRQKKRCSQEVGVLKTAFFCVESQLKNGLKKQKCILRRLH